MIPFGPGTMDEAEAAQPFGDTFIELRDRGLGIDDVLGTRAED